MWLFARLRDCKVALAFLQATSRPWNLWRHYREIRWKTSRTNVRLCIFRRTTDPDFRFPWSFSRAATRIKAWNWDYKRESSRLTEIASRQVLLGSPYRWTCMIMYRKPRNRCSSVIFIKQLITMYANACVPLYINLCESYARLRVSYTHFIPLTLDKVTIVRNFFYVIIRRFISMHEKW